MIYDISSMPLWIQKKFKKTLRDMCIGQTYQLLKNHNKPSVDFTLPSKYMGGCYMSSKPGWLGEFPELTQTRW
jgi:hypothetical protein